MREVEAYGLAAPALQRRVLWASVGARAIYRTWGQRDWEDRKLALNVTPPFSSHLSSLPTDPTQTASRPRKPENLKKQPPGQRGEGK